jgi:hypothetical protein
VRREKNLIREESDKRIRRRRRGKERKINHYDNTKPNQGTGTERGASFSKK